MTSRVIVCASHFAILVVYNAFCWVMPFLQVAMMRPKNVQSGLLCAGDVFAIVFCTQNGFCQTERERGLVK